MSTHVIFDVGTPAAPWEAFHSGGSDRGLQSIRDDFRSARRVSVGGSK